MRTILLFAVRLLSSSAEPYTFIVGLNVGVAHQLLLYLHRRASLVEPTYGTCDGTCANRSSLAPAFLQPALCSSSDREAAFLTLQAAGRQFQKALDVLPAERAGSQQLFLLPFFSSSIANSPNTDLPCPQTRQRGRTCLPQVVASKRVIKREASDA